jgi:putative peptide zinc metalloprotease protein
MAVSHYSPSWYRVCGLRPRLRAHVQIHRQSFRGTVWHVVQDTQSGRFHRLSTAAYHLVCLMDGRRTVEEIWLAVCERMGAQQPTQEDVVRLLSLLHGADLTTGGTAPHLDDLTERERAKSRQDMWSRVRNPLAIRLPLVDPDRFLTATLPFLRPLFTRWALVAWSVLVLIGAVLAAVNWDALMASVFETEFLAQNIALALLIFPVVKLVHELGHGYATKMWGGEVHELGVMLLAFMPVPYVDASASTAFRERGRRAVVGGAGIIVELAIAALGMIVWVLAEPSLVRAVAFNVVLTCSVSTLVFNANPLLRFDGYYVLSDLIEVPNLAQRSNRYMMHLIQHRLFGLPDLESPVEASGEPLIFVVYAVASFIYRTVVMVGVALFIATHFVLIGVPLAIASLVTAIVWPLMKGLHYVLADPRLGAHRRRAVIVSGLGVGILLVLLLAVPLPYATLAQGVVWVADDAATVRVRSPGVVAAVPAGDGSKVDAQAPLIDLDDPVLAIKARIAEKQLEELRIKLEALDLSDRVGGNILREQIRESEAQLADMRRQIDDLALLSPAEGRLRLLDATDLMGRYPRKGDVVGYVVSGEGPVVRAFVPQSEIDLVLRHTSAVAVRLAADKSLSLPAQIEREVPAAVTELPHPVLAPGGGGSLLVDPNMPGRLKPLDTLFEVDLRVSGLRDDAPLGMRAYVRFQHPPEPIALRWIRDLRQLFLRHFDV